MKSAHFIYKTIDGNNKENPALKSIFRLRYQVYVNEWGFEKPEDHHPDGFEMDEYDDQSLHIYACSQNSDKVIGTARIILGSERPFPIERHFDVGAFPVKERRGQVGEISRLAISKHFRRRAIDRTIFGEDDGFIDKLPQQKFIEAKNVEGERRKVEHELILGIYLLIYGESIKLGLTHWYAVMARGLYIILGRWGIPFKQIGPERDYHGFRAPYAVSIRDLERHLEKKNPDLIALARQGLDFS